MDTEEYEKRGFPIIRFLVKLIILILLFILLFLLYSKYVSSPVKIDKKTKCNESDCISSNNDTSSSQIFIDNIDKMKDAAISYYTDERLPQEVGQSKKKTLAEMIDENIIVPLIDKNDKEFDAEKSYVQVIKENDEYILKVYLKDSNSDDYILVHLGTYSYCDSFVCEKRFFSLDDNKSIVSSTVPIKGTIHDGIYQEPTTYTPIIKTSPDNKKCVYDSYNDNYYDKNGKTISKLKFLKSCLNPKCKKVSTYYFDINGNSVSYNEFEKSCSKGRIKDIYKCSKVNGYYYDSNGNKVSYDKYKNSCGISSTEDVKYICKIVNNNYYDELGNKVSKLEYIKSCKKPICEKISGYFFGVDGDSISEAQFNKECDNYLTSIEDDWLYEYFKTSGAEFTEWTNWSNWSKTGCDTQTVNCRDNDISCLKKVQIYKRKEQTGTHQKSYAKTREHIMQTGYYTKKSCSNYEYVEINKTLYVSDNFYSQVSNITKSTASTLGGWTYNGRKTYDKVPKSSITDYYVFVGADYSYCDDTCTSLPTYYYDSYTYSGLLEEVNSTTTPGSNQLSESNTSSSDGRCGNYVSKIVPVYKTVTITEKVTRTEPLYEDVCYESIKTRNLIEDGSSKYKWSTYNDTSLLNNGWVYTGEKKPNVE